MISANGGLPAHRYTAQVTQTWPRVSEPASLLVVPPYSVGECFVSLWGPGYQREVQGNVRFYPDDKEVEESLMHVVGQHAIWRVMPRINEAASTRSQWAPDDREEDWSFAREEVEVAFHHKLYQRNDQRNVPDIGWIKSTAWKLKKKRQQRTKTGGYVPVSELISVPTRDWGSLKSIAEDDPVWRVPSVSEFEKVLWCGGDQTTVELVLGPRFTGLDSGCESIGRRVVQLYTAGAAALTPDRYWVRSGVIQSGNTFFHFQFHPAVLADVGIVR